MPMKKLKSRKEFRSLLYDCDLHDLGSIGPTFTWSNKGNFTGLSNARLDKGILNMHWADWYRNTLILLEPILASGHNALIVDIEPTVTLAKPSFNTRSFWFFQNDCFQLINTYWSNGSPRHWINDFINDQNKIKPFLLKWHKIFFRKMKKEIENLRLKI